MSQIYVAMLDEGTEVYCPVVATRVDENVYKIDESNEYDPSDEKWEFEPGDIVIVEERLLRGQGKENIYLVAVKLWQEKLKG